MSVSTVDRLSTVYWALEIRKTNCVSIIPSFIRGWMQQKKGDQYGHPFLVQTPKTLCEYRQFISKLP